ncbi:MAG: hypothetical protein A2X18_07770 [Bacteroidetes bacterium GWF2_40_14]|nr:MAG: hypothetical protein A2X18_07770 [Bacteroidetes bacterium GWF2_40_14]
MKTGFFDSLRGNRSSSRLIGFIVIVVTLIFVQEILYFGRNNIIQAAIAAGTIFLTIAGPAMAFLFAQKKTEIKSEGNPSQNQ